MMDYLGKALKDVFEQKKREVQTEQKKLEALAPHFETEAEALAYAKRLATLKAGDEIILPNEDNSALHNGVYMGNEGSQVICLFYNDDKKILAIQKSAWVLVTLKD